MELVSGEPITDYCDRKRLSVRARLELFVAVCQAVQHAHQKGIIDRDLKRALQGDLDWIVMMALEKDRTRRYATANGFAADILRHLAHEPVVAAPPSRAYRLRKFVRKHRGAVIAASLVLLSLLGGLAVLAAVQTVANTRLAASLARESSANTALALANDNLVESRAAVQEQLTRSEWLVYAGKLMQAQNDFEAGDGGLALHYLDACQWNLRGWEHRYLWTRINAKQTLVGHAAPVWSVAYSPDGKRIVTSSGDRTAKVWDSATGLELLALTGHTGEVHCASFSPDGKRIVTGSMVTTVAFSTDGQRIFAWDSRKNVLAWSAADGKPIAPVDPPPAPVPGPARSPDGFRHALPQGNTIAVTDKRPPAKDNAWPLPDAAERKRYHTEHADLAVQEKQWFAAEFHLRRVLRDDPENATVKTRLALMPFKAAYDDKKFALAVRLWTEALERHPKLGDDPLTLARYNAARAAAMAASGQGQCEPPLDDAAKTKLRSQALDWLKAELKALEKLLASGQPQVRAAVVQALQHWNQDSDLAGIRAARALAGLPEAERQEWQEVWAEVEALLKRAREPKRVGAHSLSL